MHVVAESGAAIGTGREFSERTHFSYWPLAVGTRHAETRRLDPLERLLFPFDGHSIHGKTQTPARVSQTLARSPGRLNRGNAGIAIEAIGVGNEGTELFRTGL